MVVKGGVRTSFREFAGGDEAAENLGDLQVDQMGCRNGLSGSQDPLDEAGMASRPEQKFQGRRCVEDDHRRSRSAPTALLGDVLRRTGGRCRRRLQPTPS
jgi:hypothetical protein